ncbi:MAG: hypothetical protein Q9190_001361 [Brigantiaea leucoxantha]
MSTPQPGIETHSIHHFNVPFGSTFDEPSTASGAKWRSTLQTLADAPGWSDAWWGRLLEDPQQVDLLIGWSTFQAAQAFFASDQFAVFAAKLQPLLSQPPSTPFAVQLLPSVLSGVAAFPEGITTMHKAYFDNVEDIKQTQRYETNVFNFAQHVHARQDPQIHPDLEETPFLGQARGWAIPLSLSSSLEETPILPNKSKSIFVILLSWLSIESEREASQINTPGHSESLYDYYIQSVLDKAAGGFDRHHLHLDFLFSGNLDRKERSSEILSKALSN